MASIYSCTECGTNFNLKTNNRFPSDFSFEAGNKGTLSFSLVDESKFRFKKEDKFMPFFETVNCWGIWRKRTKINCNRCGLHVGYVYDDVPPLTTGPVIMTSIRTIDIGPSEIIQRALMYRFKTNALKIASKAET